MKKQRTAAVVVASGVVMLAAVQGATGCAQDGCDTVTGTYRFGASLSAGQGCEPSFQMIVDTEATSDSDGCGRKTKTTEGADSCRNEVTAACPDGRSYVDVMTCEDDGEKCNGTISFNYPDGSACIYDYTATRL